MEEERLGKRGKSLTENERNGKRKVVREVDGEREGEEKKEENTMKGEIVAGSDVWGGEAPSPVPSGVIGSWTANLSQLNQQQQR